MRGFCSAAAGAVALAAVLCFPTVSVVPGARAGDREDLRRDAVVKAVESARPAVVNINAEEETIRSNPFAGSGDPFFDRFFRDFFETAPRRRAPAASLGSGAIIDPSGYILTNEHVVARASSIRVTLADERSFDAKIVGSDPDHDLAVLKVEAPGDLPFLPLGTSADILVGEKVVAIGNPFGLSHTVTTGVVSANRRSIRTSDGRLYYDFIQTDAAINPGNSGGPLLNIEGRMVGINTAIYAEGYGIGFAIPADAARRVVDDLLRYGEVHPVWIGMAVGEWKQGGARQEQQAQGVQVTALLKGGPGERAGLRRGDVVLRVGGEAARSAGEYRYRVGAYKEGDLVPLSVLRGKKTVDFVVRAEPPGADTAGRILWEWFGLEAVEDRSGLAVGRVRRGGPASRTGLRSGDRILEVGGEGAGDAGKVEEEVFKAGQNGRLLMLIQRGRWGYSVTLQVLEN